MAIRRPKFSNIVNVKLFNDWRKICIDRECTPVLILCLNNEGKLIVNSSDLYPKEAHELIQIAEKSLANGIKDPDENGN